MRYFFLLLPLLFLGTAGCGDTVGPAAGAPSPTPAGSKPYNVILISVDTLRADRLSRSGYGFETTPNIDRFAKKSVVFTNAHSQSSWTTPSHASLFTSLYPSVLNLRHWPDPGKISPKAYTLAELLRDRGYAAAGFLEAGLVSSKFGFNQGFAPYKQGFKHIHESVPACLEWIDGHLADRFFVFLHTYDVHRYEPPEEFDGRFTDRYEGGVAKGKELRQRIQKFKNQDFLKSLDVEDRRRIVALYNESLLYVDSWLGRLFDGLEARGLMKNTIVILVSDHGEEFWDHGHTGHGYTSFEEMLHVPVIIYHPDMPSGRKDDLIGLIDIPPTVAEMVGAPVRPEWQGRSFFSLLRGLEGKGRRLCFAEGGHRSHEGHAGRHSVREGQWKLIRLIPSNKEKHLKIENRLYDIANDPKERTDVSAEFPAVFQRLKRVLDAWQKTNRARSRNYRALESGIDPETKKQLEDLGYTGG